MIDLLFVCTGNVCRSPMAEALARRLLAGREIRVRSAGILGPGRTATPETVEALARRGLDASSHRSRLLGDALEPLPDLMVGMAREHVRDVADLRPDLLPRTFTLKELVRRADAAGPRRPGEDLGAYLGRIAAGRRPSQLVGASLADDIPDPIGMPPQVYERCADEIAALVGGMVARLWP